MDFKIKQITPQDYKDIRMLDREAFGCNERGSDADFHDKNDDHNTKCYKYQRKGIGTALVKRGIELAAALGYTACMVCGNPCVYREKMGFTNYLELGIVKDESVDDPDWAIFARELQANGFQETDKVLSFQSYSFLH